MATMESDEPNLAEDTSTSILRRTNPFLTVRRDSESTEDRLLKVGFHHSFDFARQKCQHSNYDSNESYRQGKIKTLFLWQFLLKPRGWNIKMTLEVPKRQPYDYLVRILLVGDSGVGKTSLVMRLSENHFSPNFITTIGVDFKIKFMDIG